MTKIFQKSLASVLALALCLTALITASATVSAEEGTSTTAPTLEYVVTPASPKKGETVKVELVAKNFNDVTIFGADIATYYDSKLELTADNITFGFKDGYETVTVDKSFDAVNKKIGIVGLGGYENGVYTPFLDNFNSTTLYSFEFVAGDAGTEYTFSFADDTKVRFCTSGETPVTVAAAAKTVTVAADAHVHNWGTPTIVKQPTMTEEGEKLYTCACGETKTEKIDIPTKNEAVKFPVDIILEDNIALRIRSLPSQLSAANYSGFFIKFNYDCYESSLAYDIKSNEATITDADFAPLTATVNKTLVALQRSFDIGLPISAVAYFTDADGVVVGYNDFMATTVKDVLLGKISGFNDNSKRQAVDLVNFAEAARLYFASTNSTKDIANGAAINADFSAYQSYASTDTEFTYNTTDTATPEDSTKTKILKDYLIGASNDLRFRIACYKNYVAPENLSVKFYYTNGYTGKLVSTELAPLTDLECMSENSTMNIYKSVFSLALFDLNKTVTAEVYENGIDTPIYTANYCLESYVHSYLDPAGKNYGKANEVTENLLIAAMRFSKSSRIAFSVE